ncbi:MAG: HK97 gp10 family phage protein [Hamadaea sp.]|nr:HK97 gp10 family phage protein [Catenulispora sp.]NUT08175.1 HK97 gp10 family phage protein [Hamadaea sp.]
MASRSQLPASYQFSQLQRELNKMPAAQQRKMRTVVRQVGQSALSDARSRAGSWSRRIPASISMRDYVSPAQGRVGVELRASKSVPHARPYEGISQQGSTSYFRHPVFGNRERWVSQKTRPYLWPAVNGRAPAMRAGIEKAVDDAARECGFR